MTVKELLEHGGYNDPVRLYTPNEEEIKICPNDDAIYTPDIILPLAEEMVWLWRLVNHPVAAWHIDSDDHVLNILVAEW